MTNKQKGKLHIKIGLPGSGKTTQAKEEMKANGNLIRINRDDIRSMIMLNWKGKKEDLVTKIQLSAVNHALDEGYDVVVDDTNLNPSTLSRWQNLALSKGLPCLLEHMQMPLDECITRDSCRGTGKQVGRAVIENMALSYGLLPKLKEEDKVVIFDMDGTLADSSHRTIYLNMCKNCNFPESLHPQLVNAGSCIGFLGGKKNYSLYYNHEEILEDKPACCIIKWANECYKAGYIVLIVSGRPTNKAGIATDEWLKKYNVHYHHLFMRKADDHRADFIIKEEILDKMLRWIKLEQILFATDDRDQVCALWKRRGIKCYPIAQDGKGDF